MAVHQTVAFNATMRQYPQHSGQDTRRPLDLGGDIFGFRYYTESEHFPDEPVGTPADGPGKDATGKIHTWASNDGYKVDAVLVGYGYAETTKAPYVVLKTGEGKQIEVPFERLSEQSQQLAKELVSKLKAANAP